MWSADTAADWVLYPNPFGGAPIARYSPSQPVSDGDKPNLYPIGSDYGHLSDSDRLAFDVLNYMYQHDCSFAEAKAVYAAFTPITKVQSASGPVDVTTLDASAQKQYAQQSADRASLAAAAVATLQTGVMTTPPAPLPPVTVSDMAPLVDPISTVKPVLKLSPTGFYSDPNAGTRVPVNTPVVGDTNAGSTATTPAPSATGTSSTATGSGNVTAADLGAQTTAATSKDDTTKQIAIAVAGTVIAAVIVAVLMKSGGAS